MWNSPSPGIADIGDPLLGSANHICRGRRRLERAREFGSRRAFQRAGFRGVPSRGEDAEPHQASVDTDFEPDFVTSQTTS